MAGSLITMGTLGDRIGRRRLLPIGAALFGVASMLARSRSDELHGSHDAAVWLRSITTRAARQSVELETLLADSVVTSLAAATEKAALPTKLRRSRSTLILQVSFHGRASDGLRVMTTITSVRDVQSLRELYTVTIIQNAMRWDDGMTRASRERLIDEIHAHRHAIFVKH